jgi:hypothetical protein
MNITLSTRLEKALYGARIFVPFYFDWSISILTSQCRSFFACDDQFLAPPWQSMRFNTSVNSVETTLPPQPIPSMVYPRPSYDRAPHGSSDTTSTVLSVETYNDLIDLSIPVRKETFQPSWENSKGLQILLTDNDLGRATARSRRRAFKDPKDRAQTAQTRRDNACIRCRMQRIRVSFDVLVSVC